MEDMLQPVVTGCCPWVCVEPTGQVRTTGEWPRLLLPGSFHPLHAGHRRLAETAGALLGIDPAFELSILNVDKPPLTVEEIRRRLAQFAGLASVWLTRAPTFAEKASLFPGVVFVVGVDTAARLVEPRYYAGDPVRMTRCLDHLQEQGCRFLVAGRSDAAGRFVQLADVSIPEAGRDLFAAIPEPLFRVEISSTQLRREPTRKE